MSLVKYNTKKAATEGRRMRLNIPGMTDRKIFLHVLGDDAAQVSKYVDAANKRHFEENGIVDRTPDQVMDFMRGKFVAQVTAVESQILDPENNHVSTIRPEIEVEDGVWLPAGQELADKIFDEDMKMVYEPTFAYARNRSNFLPSKGDN